jgi:SAM-dependent methyltransferase
VHTSMRSHAPPSSPPPRSTGGKIPAPVRAPKATPYHAARHLTATQLIAARERCPVCGSGIPRHQAGVIQREPDVYLLHCPDCRACSASHMPSPAVLDEYYRNYFGAAGPKTTMPRVPQFVRNLLRSVASDALPTHVRLLDFGGGDGTLGLAIARKLLAARPEQTVEFSLVDYQTPVAGHADARLGIAHHRSLDEVDTRFDLVLASAVLEHIPDLRRVLPALLRLLAPGGWFYARTPWIAPFKRWFPGLDITYPGHVHDLGAAFWNRVPQTYRLPLQVVASRPSLVETSWRQAPVRTLAAWGLKLPAWVELALVPSPHTPLWRFVGGWEVILRRPPDA